MVLTCNKVLRVFSLVLFSLGLNGCACGIIFYSSETKELAPLDFKERYVNYFESVDIEDMSKEVFVSKLGEPDDKQDLGGKEIWSYRSGFKFRGAVVILFNLPVPLALPVGYNTSEIEFNGGKFDKAVIESTLRESYYCGVMPNGEEDFCW